VTRPIAIWARSLWCRGVVIGTRPQRAEETMRECTELGIKHVWMHRGPGGGSVSQAATAYGREHGITVIGGGCPCMFGPAADRGHKAMRFPSHDHRQCPEAGVTTFWCVLVVACRRAIPKADAERAAQSCFTSTATGSPPGGPTQLSPMVFSLEPIAAATREPPRAAGTPPKAAGDRHRRCGCRRRSPGRAEERLHLAMARQQPTQGALTLLR
jgi:CoA binding domain